MKKFISLFLIFNFFLSVSASTIQGGVSERGFNSRNRITDKKTGEGVSGAQVTLPKERFTTKTDKNGYFELNTQIEATSVSHTIGKSIIGIQ